jgi:uncharacterized protein YodC (DUF2158 family)
LKKEKFGPVGGMGFDPAPLDMLQGSLGTVAGAFSFLETHVQGFKIGDVVTLKSGGWPMTVADAGGLRGGVLCQWFSRHGTLHEALRPAACLMIARRLP